jgi:hypothetical protein
MRDPASQHLRMPARRSSPCPSPRRGTHIPMSIRFFMYRFGRRTASQYIRCQPEDGSSCRIYPHNLRKHPQKSSNFSIFQYLALWRACESQVLSGTLCRPVARDFGLSMRIVALGLLSCYLRKPEIHALIRSPVTHTQPHHEVLLGASVFRVILPRLGLPRLLRD